MNIRELAIKALRRPSPMAANAQATVDLMANVAREAAGAVERGELGLVGARRAARDHAERLKADLTDQAARFAPGDPAIRKAVVDRGEALKIAGRGERDGPAETNRLLRRLVRETEISNRAAEFQARGYRARAGDAPLATPETLLSFHELASAAGDEAAVEWCRRELAGVRHQAVRLELLERVDMAATRPGELNPIVAARYVAILNDRVPADPGKLLEELLSADDVTGAVALVAWASASGNPTAVRAILDRSHKLPAPVIEAVRAIDAEATADARQAAAEHVALAAARIDDAAALDGLEAPRQADLARAEQSAAARAADAERNGAALAAL